MNIAIIFAGGVGKRMGQSDKPKQFMEISGKPIIIHTLEKFEKNENIDKIIISSVESWIPYLKKLLEQYDIKKVDKIVAGGETGQMSIFRGLQIANQLYPEDSIVLIHDGVRPFIDDELINNNIMNVKKKGSAISSVMSTETFVLVDNDKNIKQIPERSKSMVAKAPQSFYLKDIFEVHLKAQQDNIYNSTDSCTLMNIYNRKMSVVMTDYDNIKITTPKDITLAEAIFKRKNDNILI